MNQFEPGNYQRRILLVVSGMSPQILTETLYALTQKREPAFVPTEVHMLTTGSGAEHARLNLLVGSGQFLKFCADYTVDPAIFNEARIHCITSGERSLDDIRSVAENEAAADFITNFIRTHTADEESALHVSMAGGRKTMGYYAGYALSLYGRPQDRLSHVLVSEGFEGHRDFYYPTRDSQIIHRQNGPALDASRAEVTLAEIPFVRLRSEVPQRLLDGEATFGETIQMAQRSLEPQRLHIDLPKLDFRVGEISLNGIGGANLAFLIWLVSREKTGQPRIKGSDLIDFNKVLGHELQALCWRLEQADNKRKQALEEGGTKRKDMQRIFDGLKRSTESLDLGLDRGSFDSRLSPLNKAILKQLGVAMGKQFTVHNFGGRGQAEYGLLHPERIELTPFA